ncbi:MAG: transglutaminase-like domain-containing protein [Eubacteriales bacterium]|nr:transglutaminase-like domain-containing protein [Eubacteriales bacterium]
MPILTGVFYPISGSRIHYSVHSVLGGLKLILGIILTFLFIKVVFSGKENNFLEILYNFIPNSGEFISTQQYDIAAYIIATVVLLFIILWILELLTIPLYKYVLAPLTDEILSSIESMGTNAKRVFSGAWQIPKSLCMVLIFSLLLNFYTTYVNNPSVNNYINNSKAYQFINNNIVSPVLSTDTVQQLPVLVSDSFKRAAEDFAPANNDTATPNYWNLPVIKYFNGMTLEEAVKSNASIDNTAKEIVGAETDDRKKAYLLYEWICNNIEYDRDKAKVIVNDSSRVHSGSIVTYSERKGVCFDYACLYISMCRAVGVQVRFVTGLAYSGIEWGDHAWTQIYDATEDRWINVDPTFGSSGYNSFDTSNFSKNHKYDVVQAEW